MKPGSKADISPKLEKQEIRGKQEQAVKTGQGRNRPTLEMARKSFLRLDELDMIVTNRGTSYFQN